MSTIFDFSYLKDNLLYVNIFGQNWIMPLILLLLFVFIISRRPSKWGMILFPMAVGMKTMGIYFPLPVFIAISTLGGLAFVASSLGIENIGGLVKGGVKEVPDIIKGKYNLQQNRINKNILEMENKLKKDKLLDKLYGLKEPTYSIKNYENKENIIIKDDKAKKVKVNELAFKENIDLKDQKVLKDFEKRNKIKFGEQEVYV